MLGNCGHPPLASNNPEVGRTKTTHRHTHTTLTHTHTYTKHQHPVYSFQAAETTTIEADVLNEPQGSKHFLCLHPERNVWQSCSTETFAQRARVPLTSVHNKYSHTHTHTHTLSGTHMALWHSNNSNKINNMMRVSSI